MARERNRTGQFLPTHNSKKTKLYGVWCAMKSRCYNQNNKSYKNYGAKGITVCDEWKNDFVSFKEWASNNGYKEGLSIDRIDYRKGYSPKNCRWITLQAQNKNYSKNHLITYNGETLCLSDMADKYCINRGTVLKRLKYNLPLSEVFDNKDRRYKNGKKLLSSFE